MKRLVTFVATALMAGAGAYAQSSGEDRPRSARPVDANPERIVCIVERHPGSLIVRRKVCRTRAAWAEHKAQAREVTERVQALKLSGR